MTETVTTAFAAALGLGWAVLALALLLRKAGLRQSLPRVWRGHSALAQIGGPLRPNAPCFNDYDSTRLGGNEILVGDSWICENGDLALSATLPVLVAPVEEFYRWYNQLAVCGGGFSRATDTREPSAFPDTASDQRNVIFIHGFSVDEDGASGWNAEMFKRLWQSGCNSMFHAVTWYGNDGMLWNAFDGGDNYHGNVVHAFETAPAFASQFASLSGETTVLAHSLGNMVVCSAIQDHGFRPDRYFMLNAAVPAEAFDATQWNTSTYLNPMLHEEQLPYIRQLQNRNSVLLREA